MTIKKIIFYCFIFLVVSSITYKKTEINNMAVDFDGADDRIIYNPSGALTDDVANITIMAWVKIDAITTDETPQPILRKLTSGGTNNVWEMYLLSNGSYQRLIMILRYTSGVKGSAYEGTIVSSNWQLLTATAELNTAANPYKLYINGAEVSPYLAQDTTSGTRRSETGGVLVVGNNFGGTQGHDGLISSVLLYNRILSATEIADAYASKLAIPTYRGLIFAPQLQGAAGLQVFDGATLGASNTIADIVTGTLGVPTGSPTGKADTYLNY